MLCISGGKHLFSTCCHYPTNLIFIYSNVIIVISAPVMWDLMEMLASLCTQDLKALLEVISALNIKCFVEIIVIRFVNLLPQLMVVQLLEVSLEHCLGLQLLLVLQWEWLS